LLISVTNKLNAVALSSPRLPVSSDNQSLVCPYNAHDIPMQATKPVNSFTICFISFITMQKPRPPPAALKQAAMTDIFINGSNENCPSQAWAYLRCGIPACTQMCPSYTVCRCTNHPSSGTYPMYRKHVVPNGRICSGRSNQY